MNGTRGTRHGINCRRTRDGVTGDRDARRPEREWRGKTQQRRPPDGRGPISMGNMRYFTLDFRRFSWMEAARVRRGAGRRWRNWGGQCAKKRVTCRRILGHWVFDWGDVWSCSAPIVGRFWRRRLIIWKFIFNEIVPYNILIIIKLLLKKKNDWINDNIVVNIINI